MRHLSFALAALALALQLPAQEARIASDFEIAEMQKQLSQSTSFEVQLGARLNLGDARASRSEMSLARLEWGTALALAQKERIAAREAASLSRYAAATAWAAIAAAKIGRPDEAFELSEESVRYASDDAGVWNLAASAMRTAGLPRKAASAARNAVAIAERTPGRRLDLDVYRYALATALIESGERVEAGNLLTAVTADLRSDAFEMLRREAAHLETFEVYGSPRGDVAAWVSLINRAQLRLAALREESGDAGGARREYERVLEGRTDDPTALAALARLAVSGIEREHWYAAAFEANPFSMRLMRQYRSGLSPDAAPVEGTTTGASMRRALMQLDRGEKRAARATLDELLLKFPANETLRALRAEAEGAPAVTLPGKVPGHDELLALLEGFQALSASQRRDLDAATYAGSTRFDAPAARDQPGVTVFTSGTVEGIPFRFNTPAAFRGIFHAGVPLRLTYRILGVTRAGDRDALLLEPLRLEPTP